MSDVFAQQAENKRRRELLAAMSQQNMTAPIVGNTGAAQAIAKLGTSWLLDKAEKDQASRESQTDKSYQELLGKELEGFVRKSEGAPGETLNDSQASALMNNDVNPGTLAEPIKADPKRAMLEAMASRLPEMKGIGAAQLQERLKGRQADKPIEVNGQLVDPATGAIKGDYRTKDEWEQVTLTGADGKPLIAQKNKRTGQIDAIDKAPKVTATSTSSSNPFVAGAKEGMKAWAEQTGKQVAAASESAVAAVKMLDTVKQLEELNKTNLPMGPTANPQVFLGSLAQSMGIPVDSGRLANAQTFESEATRAWAAMMGQMGGARGLVKEESEKISRSLPSLSQTPEGRAQIMGTLKRAAEQQIKDAQSMQKSFGDAIKSDDPSLFTYGLGQTGIPRTTPIPAMPASPTGAAKPMTLDEYLKSKGQ